jgi:bleomycin hydrolase
MLFIELPIKNNMRPVLLTFCAIVPLLGFAQPSSDAVESTIKMVPYTSMKNQASTSTCWSFAATSLVESEAIHANVGEFDLSEMFTVRNIYIEKAKNYILRQGDARFSPGGLAHDVIRAIDTYGAVPDYVYSGLLLGKKQHNHDELDSKLKGYLDHILKSKPVPSDWLRGFNKIMDDYLGTVPENFTYREKIYTPKAFASEVLKFKASDYLNLTSFTHHPYNSSFVLEVPDNFSNGVYYNLPLNELMDVAEKVISKGYSLVWDGDVSNAAYRMHNGFALNVKDPASNKHLNPDMEEEPFDANTRQQLFESLTTQDDHLMHLIGIEKTKGGKRFFLVKDSYGEHGPFKGVIKLSEAYFAINTVSLVVPIAALDEQLLKRLGF